MPNNNSLINKHYEILSELLEETGDYKVLKRIKKDYLFSTKETSNNIIRNGLILDVETTGLDVNNDQIIEIGLIAFEYDINGDVIRVTDTYSSFQDVGRRISNKIFNLTGITNEMIKGQEIDKEIVEELANKANIIIAHNANFDRKFAERYWNIFANKPWACSQTEINWELEGFIGTKLNYLLNRLGLFHDEHRAIEDCWALLEILSKHLKVANKTALGSLLENARISTTRIYAYNSPYNKKDLLKYAGYSWNNGLDGNPKSWYRDIPSDKFDNEMAFLCSEIYGSSDIDLPIKQLTAFNRYSDRI